MEKQILSALRVAERHGQLAYDRGDTPTEMIYAVITNKLRECLFEIQNNLCPADDEIPDDGTVLVL